MSQIEQFQPNQNPIVKENIVFANETTTNTPVMNAAEIDDDIENQNILIKQDIDHQKIESQRKSHTVNRAPSRQCREKSIQKDNSWISNRKLKQLEFYQEIKNNLVQDQQFINKKAEMSFGDCDLFDSDIIKTNKDQAIVKNCNRNNNNLGFASKTVVKEEQIVKTNIFSHNPNNKITNNQISKPVTTNLKQKQEKDLYSNLPNVKDLKNQSRNNTRKSMIPKSLVLPQKETKPLRERELNQTVPLTKSHEDLSNDSLANTTRKQHNLNLNISREEPSNKSINTPSVKRSTVFKEFRLNTARRSTTRINQSNSVERNLEQKRNIRDEVNRIKKKKYFEQVQTEFSQKRIENDKNYRKSIKITNNRFNPNPKGLTDFKEFNLSYKKIGHL